MFFRHYIEKNLFEVLLNLSWLGPKAKVKYYFSAIEFQFQIGPKSMRGKFNVLKVCMRNKF